MSIEQIFKFDENEIKSCLPDAHFRSNGNLERALHDLSTLLARDNPNEQSAFEQSLNILFTKSEHLTSEPMAILGNIRRWAIEGLNDEDLHFNLDEREGGLCSSSSKHGMIVISRTIKARQARNILANAFIGNCRDVMASKKDKWNCGGLDFREMMLQGFHHRVSSMPGEFAMNSIGIRKMECLLVYFDICGSYEGIEKDMRVITFEHIQFTPLCSETLAGRTSSDTYIGHGLHLHTRTMESSPSHISALVNFANSNYGYGKFISSCTQEEILLMCCPELAIGMLFIGKMKDNEVVNVRGIKRFCAYNGYSDSFQCAGPAQKTDEPFTVLTLDACYSNHFTERMLWRDISKAYFSFIMLADHHIGNTPVVSTGKWGCGAFGGTATHKLLQQAVAAKAAGVDLDFSIFENFDRCDDVVSVLHSSRPSTDEVVRLLQCCKNRNTFTDDAIRFLQKTTNAVSRKKENFDIFHMV